MFSPSVADHPLRPATHRPLGRLLPHQLGNATQAHPLAPEGFDPKAICGISPGFPGLSPTIGQITYVLLTRPPLIPEGMRSTCMC